MFKFVNVLSLSLSGLLVAQEGKEVEMSLEQVTAAAEKAKAAVAEANAATDRAMAALKEVEDAIAKRRQDAKLNGSVDGAEAKVLLISPPALQGAWVKYAEMRGEQGTAMKVVTTEEIAKNYQDGDLQNKMRLCVREHVDQRGFHTVILGGDSTPKGGLIPDRDTYHKNMWGNDQDIPTDAYYLSATSWDADGDGVYGEFEEDRAAISYPDGKVAIGRIAVRTEADIEAYAAKVKVYLEGKAIDELALTCEVRGAYAKVARSGEEYIPKAWPKGKVSFFFNDVTSWDGEGERGSFDLSVENLSAKFSEGKINKWHIHGHGLIDRWVLENHESFTFKHVEELKNKERPLVITTVSCFTGHFDAAKDPCITEAMIRQPEGGAVLIVAPCREGKPHFHDPQSDFQLMVREGKLDGTTQTMTSFWVAALGEKQSKAGHALAISKAGLAEDAAKSATYHQGMCEINLIGDPSLPVR